MKKQLILTTGIVLSACSNSGHQSGGNAYNAPQYMGGQYQMNGQVAGMPTGGCAPAPIPTPCVTSTRPAPCATPLPTPCSQEARMGSRVGFPYALGGAAFGAGGVALLHNNNGNSNGYSVRPNQQNQAMQQQHHMQILQEKKWHRPTHNVAMAHHMGRAGLRNSYMARKMPYTYGDIGVVNNDFGKKLGGVQARLGYQTAGVLGAEIEGSLGVVNKKNIDLTTLDVGESKLTNVKSSVAGFAVARFDAAPGVKLIARAGMHSSKAKYATRCDGTVKNPDASSDDMRSKKIQSTAFFNQDSTNGLVLQSMQQNSSAGPKTDINVGGPKTDTGGDDPCTSASSKTDSGVAFGAGIEKELTPFDSIRADVTAYDMGDKFTKAVSVGYLRKF